MWRTSIAALLGGLALAACGSSQSPPASSSTSTPGAAANVPGPCAASQLRLSYAGTQGATGHLEVTIALRNISGRACRLKGYPVAQLLDPTGRALRMGLQRGHGFFPDTTRPARTVRLRPGARARFGLSFVTNNEFAGAHVCRTATSVLAGMSGGTTHPARVSLHRAPRITPCGTKLVVSPIYT